MSCAPTGNCAAGGLNYVGSGKAQGFVAAERNGVWGTAIEVPGLPALNTRFAEVNSVSCASPGSCAAGASRSRTRLTAASDGLISSLRLG